MLNLQQGVDNVDVTVKLANKCSLNDSSIAQCPHRNFEAAFSLLCQTSENSVVATIAMVRDRAVFVRCQCQKTLLAPVTTVAANGNSVGKAAAGTFRSIGHFGLEADLHCTAGWAKTYTFLSLARTTVFLPVSLTSGTTSEAPGCNLARSQPSLIRGLRRRRSDSGLSVRQSKDWLVSQVSRLPDERGPRAPSPAQPGLYSRFASGSSEEYPSAPISSQTVCGISADAHSRVCVIRSGFETPTTVDAIRGSFIEN